ncbi:hypothetical protein [Borreliella burgdorferi]|uniref:hypothetical protein n=1 Tax=Borreliella burgdorferi TaxID=139 RepID=UPI00017F3852|nr:hypothetical protein [Borreliella burgdorferi]ACN55497.1 hypothetical protein BBUWI9123_V0023 [Borreliella burgdorferi WI91-23]ATH10604.1 hypothetical protein BHT49_05350 [Borreliella burgdorferi]PRQ89434.1 hypothetical protein CV697_06585 [Borreliella burgdorferi]PRQ93696.1 hypothetical protein CV684_06140 [Borreliella burgdorferi]PRQ96984.1 hypothetical protein CV674_06335 [Borreliella burgdorferi]
MTQKTIFVIFLLLFIAILICNLNNNDDNEALGDIKFFSKGFTNINTDKRTRLTTSLVFHNLYF